MNADLPGSFEHEHAILTGVQRERDELRAEVIRLRAAVAAEREVCARIADANHCGSDACNAVQEVARLIRARS